jgi:hypothetical protein
MMKSNRMEKGIVIYGPVFQHDAQTVHGYLRGFLIGQPAEHWNKELLSQANGRSDMLALRAHYGGVR